MSFDYTQAIQLISGYEGVEPKVYIDTAGHPTVGVGFNLDRNGASADLAAVGANYAAVRAGTESLTTEQIDALLKKDIENAVSDAQSAVSNFDSLTPARQFVVVDMVFNLGIGGFQGFTNTIAAIEGGNYEQAGNDMQQSHWYGQVGDRAVQDIAMMKSGDWSGSGSSDSGSASGSASGSGSASHPSTQPAPSETPAPAGSPPYPGTELTVGSHGEDVQTWQERLVALGYSLSVDSAFGPITEQTTAQFQSDRGVYATQSGAVDQATWDAAWS